MYKYTTITTGSGFWIATILCIYMLFSLARNMRLAKKFPVAAVVGTRKLTVETTALLQRRAMLHDKLFLQPAA